MKRIFCLFLVVILVGGGCAWFESKEEKTAQELASEGVDLFKSGDYKKSIKAFEKLKDWYPFSKYAILAELKIADAHYKLGEYEEAVFAYEDFVNLHPRNEAVPYVVYQIGMCYFERIDTVDRDQKNAWQAMEAFGRLKKQFPNHPYAKQANERIKRCLKSLAGHEFYVGIFYYKAKRYRSALYRFNKVISEYPDVGVHQKALYYISLCEAAIKKESKPR